MELVIVVEAGRDLRLQGPRLRAGFDLTLQVASASSLFAHSHIFIFLSLFPPDTDVHHGEPSSRKDLVTSSGKWNQKTASSCQLFQDLPQLQRVSDQGRARPGTVSHLVSEHGWTIYVRGLKSQTVVLG